MERCVDVFSIQLTSGKIVLVSFGKRIQKKRNPRPPVRTTKPFFKNHSSANLVRAQVVELSETPNIGQISAVRKTSVGNAPAGCVEAAKVLLARSLGKVLCDKARPMHVGADRAAKSAATAINAAALLRRPIRDIVCLW